MRHCRVESGLSQCALARTMGIAPGYLCKLEQGRREWNLPLMNLAFSGIEGHSVKVRIKKRLRRECGCARNGSC